MSIVRLENVHKSYNAKPVLRGVSLQVESGDKIGLIGRNGTGKSTIFRLILGDAEPEQGVIERMRRARVACLEQLPAFKPEATIFDVVMEGFRELLDLEHELNAMGDRLGDGDETALARYSEKLDAFQAKGGYEFRTNAKRVLHGLGFTVDDFNLHAKALSGGQRSRLMLALVLLKDADLLLLDEPENHLDLEAQEWLEDFLQEWPRALMIISHDRRTLNAVSNRIIEVERGEVRWFTGNYDAYVANKALILEQQQKDYDRQQKHIDKETKLIDKFRYKASKAAFAQSRLKKLEKLELIDAPESEQRAAVFRLGEVVRSGAVVLEAKNLSMAYGALQLYRDVKFAIERGERVGIVGPNGAGKTTLLRHLAGRLPGGSGEVRVGHKVQVGFYDQHHESMNPNGDVMSEVHSVDPELKPEEVRRFMGRFLFTGQDVFKPIAVLSGGELSRVALAKLILGGSNCILLDEPTNHLDIASREALEDALSEFPGTLVMVSHDRALIDRLVDKLIILERGTATVHLGNYTSYRWKLSQTPDSARKTDKDEVLKIRRNDPVQKQKIDEKERRKKRKELESLERDIAAMEETLEDFDKRFLNIDPADYEGARKLKDDYDGLKRDLSELYESWEVLASEVDQK
ncbi:MAG: ABC transporter ATP-binding protein [Candidatus Hydrogenedentota bacterium]